VSRSLALTTIPASTTAMVAVNLIHSGILVISPRMAIRRSRPVAGLSCARIDRWHESLVKGP